MNTWREKYRKNFTSGIIISIFFHTTILLILFYLPQSTAEPTGYYFENTYIVKLTTVNIGKVEIVGGGGSSGNGTEGTGKNFSSKKTISGIPVPVSEPTDIDFGNVTNLIDSKDSLSGGSGMGSGSGSGFGSGTGKGIGDGSGDGIGYKSLPFVPRQILEVVPQNTDGVKGTIILVLKIGTDGFVKEHKVIYNTSGDESCLMNTVDAAYKSRWEPVKIEGRQVQYWIEKTYKFN
ncbi:MAG: energy transducer TonB [Ignavibacteriales bacterium]|nr:energy transducer TonB [Ignavibacteriales bacterium]